MNFFLKNQKSIVLSLALILIGAGFFLRLSIYQAGHELWLDEANTARKVCAFNLSEIAQLKGSSYHTMHSYPIGFMTVLKVFVNFFGPYESVLRIFPFLSSLAAIVIFWKLTRRLFLGSFFLLPLVLFCVNPSILEHSSELKPYASDVLTTLILTFLFMNYCKKTTSAKDFLVFSGIGLIMILSSFPAIFILFGSAGLLLIDGTVRKNWQMVRLWSSLLISWGSGLYAYYSLSLKFFIGDNRLFESWSSSFFPWSASISENLYWILNSLETILNYLTCPAAFALGLCLLGIIALFKKDRGTALLILSPFLTVFFLSFLKRYPLHERTVTFLAPYLIILFSAGLESLTLKFKTRSRAFRLFGASLIVYALCVSMTPLSHFQNIGAHPEDMRELLQHLDKNFSSSTDDFIVNDSGSYAFNYYSRFLLQTFPAENIFVSSDLLGEKNGNLSLVLQSAASKNLLVMDLPVRNDLNGSKTKKGRDRVWVLLSHYKEEVRIFLTDFFEQNDYVLKETSAQEGSLLLLFVQKK